MNVLMLNCSPNKHGCTYTALTHIADQLQKEGVDSKIIHCGERPVPACCLCNFCKRGENPARCVYNDVLNDVLDELDACDALIIGSPVHYASASGIATAFCDRLFRVAAPKLAYKPGAAVVSARRAGTTAALDQLNKYFTINNMPIVSSQYWNMVHGGTAQEVLQDEEGLQIMRTLARNMAWLLKCLAAGQEAGLSIPTAEEEAKRTSFIR